MSSSIISECPGLATEEVETLVTQPIEIALLGEAGVQAVRSQTTAGLNVIYIKFDWSTENDLPCTARAMANKQAWQRLVV